MYLWIKALHVISVIAWMAGMLYLPRLFVYHAATEAGSTGSETFKVMERRLLRGIMNPAMVATFVFGIWMVLLDPGLMKQGWLHGKLLLVVGMAVLHHLFSRWRKDFAADRNRRSPRFYKLANEIPTLVLIGIVLLVVVKPF
jgi:putative membrane protein